MAKASTAPFVALPDQTLVIDPTRMSHGLLTGIVSIGDVVKSQISELEFERDQLEDYVAGGGR